jgi:UMF1 family MFS transporter
MPFLLWSTLISVAATAFLARGSFVISAVLFIIGNAGYQAGLQFYDALLTEVATEENRGRISGIGVGVGYVGSYIAVRARFLYHEATSRRRGFRRVVSCDRRFVSRAVRYRVFSSFANAAIANPRPIFGWRVIKESTAETIRTLGDPARSIRAAPAFLVGRIFYTDAINTVIGFMALYTMHVSAATGLTPREATTQKSLVMAVAITFAVPAVWCGAGDRPHRAQAHAETGFSYLWMATFGLGRSDRLFQAAGVLAVRRRRAWPASRWPARGSADRPYMLRHHPPDRVGEFYGLYAWSGPLLGHHRAGGSGR